MSAVIQNEYTGNNSTTTYSFTFPYLKTSDIKASLDGVATTAFTLPNATTLQFNTAPGSGVKIKIFRETGVDDLTATFYAGSAIKSEDLNDNFTQNLYKTQEVGARAISALGGTMTGNLVLDTQADLVFEGATADAHETTIKVVDPTADRTITFPNVTGTVVTTGDTGTVATGMIANDAITNAKIADDQIDSEHYVDGSIDTAHIADAQVTTAKIADSNVTAAKLSTNAVTNAKIANNAITSTKIAGGSVLTNKIANDAVTGAKIADNSIDSEHYVDGSIDSSHIAANVITNSMMTDDSVGTAELQDSSVDTARLADNAVTLAKMADNSVGTSEIVNDAVTNAKIADNSIDSEHYVDGSIDTAHIADSQITTAKLANSAVTNAKIADGTIATAKYQTGSVSGTVLANGAVTEPKIQDGNVTTPKLADAELRTLANMQSGTASKLADSTALTADIADLNQIDGLTKQTTITDSDASFPTSGAVVDYVAAQIAPLGGLEVIATEVAFPNTQPQAGVVISISDAGGVVFNGSGTSTTGRTVGGSTVTINNAPSSLNSETLVAGVGLMVSSTGSGQVYNYHKILGKEDDIKQLSDDINDFNARYRVGSSNPTSALDGGDLFFNTTTGKLLVYNNTNTAWEEAQSIGNFFISTLSPAFDGSTQNFTITNAPTNVQQVLLSINGVVQKPNAGTSTPSEGFALDGSTIKLAAAPPTGSPYFAIVMGSTVNIGTPSNNTVSTAILQNGSVTTAKIADDAVTGAKIADDAVGAEHIEVLDADLVFADNVKAKFGTSHDLHLSHNGTNSVIENTTGDLFLQCVGTNADDIFIKAKDDIYLQPANGEKGIEILGDGAVELYYDNSKKFETTGGGAKVTGNLKLAADNNKAIFGVGNDLQIYHDGTNSLVHNDTGSVIIENDASNTNSIFIKAKSGEHSIIANHNGGVELYYDNSKKFETTSVGVKVTGNIIPDANNTRNIGDGTTNFNAIWASTRFRGNDDVSLQLGNSVDFKIRHDGTTNLIESPTGADLHIKMMGNTNDVADQTSAKFIEDGAVELYHNGTKKLETTSTGIKVEGDNLELFRYRSYNSDAATYQKIGTNNDSVDNNKVHQWRFGLTGNASSGNSFVFSNLRSQQSTYTEELRLHPDGGISFNGDTAGANALDDYEEGNWTPTVSSGSGSITVHSAKYTKIGQMVAIQFYISINNTSTNGNQANLNGLPFTVKASGWTAAKLATGYSRNEIHCRTIQNSTVLDIKGDADTTVTFSQLNGTWALSSIVYFTDS